MHYIVKKTLGIIHEKGGIGIVQVKKNQKELLKLCKKIHEKGEAKSKFSSRDKGHGRLEKREASVFDLSESLIPKWEKLIKTLIVVDKGRSKRDTKNKKWAKGEEISFYVCTDEFSAEQSLYYIRNHWGIENQNHYVRDVSMGEDASRIRVKPFLIAIIRSFALNILRFFGVENIKEQLYINSLSATQLIQSLISLCPNQLF